jgi:predicted dehydrogenase
MLRLGVVGAGIMGANHARVSAALRDAAVTWIVDPDEEKGATLARATGADWSPDLDRVTEHIDAAIVAAPSSLHCSVGLQLIDAGIHVLVEKPIATTVEDAVRLVEAAHQRGVTLAIGHVESYNAAAWELDRLVDRPIHIEATRISPYSPRIADDVVLDLMIHDIEIALRVAGSPPADVCAVMTDVRSATADLACALVRFQNGVTANLTASRLGQNKIREVRITQADNFVTVDLVRQDVTISRVDHSEFVSDEGARYRQTGMIEIPFLERRGEPLFLELAHFVECVREGAKPRVSGEEGLAALRLALAVRSAGSGGLDHQRLH